MPRSISRRLAMLVAVAAFAIGIPLGAVIAGIPTFNDVPTSNPFYNDITAIANAGVTTGCGGGNYCPKDNVTREQMAAFMNRLGALAPGKTPVVNADKVDGVDANGLIRVAAASGTTSAVAISSTNYQTALSVDITAPTSGFVLVNWAIGAQNKGTSCSDLHCGVFARVRDADSGSFSPYLVFDVHGTTAPNNAVSSSYVFAVDAGDHTFEIQVQRASSSDTVTYFSPSLTALFTPFGSAGGSTLSPSDAAASGGAPAGAE